MKTDALKMLDLTSTHELMEKLYGKNEVESNVARYKDLVAKFEKEFGDKDMLIFTSPGRTEISGNHTDHNHGKVLAGSINLDCVGVAAKNDSNIVNIVSETFNQKFSINLADLSPSSKMAGTVDLVKGLLKGFEEKGYTVGGFDAYITSNVISAAGVSSSAAFEMLLCSMLNVFFNDNKMDVVAYAHVGKYSENHYWNKSSGLLDQMACAVGGLITIDFYDPKNPVVEQIPFDFSSQNYSLIIVNTGKGHADLSADYSSVPNEMKKVAEYFGKEVCAQVKEEDVIANLSKIREYAGDRSVMRALHFFEENKRVEAEVAALKENRFDDFLAGITASGNSSWKWLQNCISKSNDQDQKVALMLALTELYLEKIQDGCCRVHGGGFAGVILAVIPRDKTEDYVKYISAFVGEENVYPMQIRQTGAVSLGK